MEALVSMRQTMPHMGPQSGHARRRLWKSSIALVFASLLVILALLPAAVDAVEITMTAAGAGCPEGTGDGQGSCEMLGLTGTMDDCCISGEVSFADLWNLDSEKVLEPTMVTIIKRASPTTNSTSMGAAKDDPSRPSISSYPVTPNSPDPGTPVAADSGASSVPDSSTSSTSDSASSAPDSSTSNAPDSSASSAPDSSISSTPDRTSNAGAPLTMSDTKSNSATPTPTNTDSTSDTSTPSNTASTSDTSTPTDTASVSDTSTPTDTASVSDTSTPTRTATTSAASATTTNTTAPASTTAAGSASESGIDSSTAPPAAPSDTSTPTAATSSAATPTESATKSASAVIPLAVGVSVGGTSLMLGVIVGVWFWRRRRHNRFATAESPPPRDMPDNLETVAINSDGGGGGGGAGGGDDGLSRQGSVLSSLNQYPGYANGRFGPESVAMHDVPRTPSAGQERQWQDTEGPTGAPEIPYDGRRFPPYYGIPPVELPG